MFRRAHHQRIERLLRGLDARLFERARCFFGGGTAITMLLDEFRESVDVDFLCSDADGYRALRLAVFNEGFDGLCAGRLETVRDVRTDQYGIRTFVDVDGTPVKFEIVREARVTLTGQAVEGLPVPVLSRDDLMVEKLLANVDRQADRSTWSRDALDLGMMVSAWGGPSRDAVDRARAAYGPTVDAAMKAALHRLDDDSWLNDCLDALGMSPDAGLVARSGLTQAVSRTSPTAPA
ncbi:MAG: nucleotidyl transferase AbiEii/AbiGii toxin family protein [Myxococcaceae bacterium]|jgi:hypothetical protein|nr:nucleotidyl transferase AbiEii/AbiGii toxin family protein [Myxococcaceae bacterium]